MNSKKPAVKIIKKGEPRQGGGVKTPAVKIVKKGQPMQGGGVKVPMPKKTTSKPTVKPKSPKPKSKSKMTPEDKAYNDMLKKYGNDVTKIPGFKNGKGTM
jgi:hypothetical protein